MLNIDKYYPDLPWLQPLKTRLQEQLADDRCPHALLIHGTAGTGRRQLALWLAEALLGEGSTDWAAGAEEDGGNHHADLFLLEPPEGKKTIGIDPVRDALIPFLNMTSHGGGQRVAIVCPADVMTAPAANSLLKTLEEPPLGSVVILVSEVPGRLPPTILSRCQKLPVAVPPPGVALAWLSEQEPDKDFSTLLEFSGGAPVAALALHEQEFSVFANEFIGALEGLERRTASAFAVAASCRDREELALRLLEWRVAGRIRRQFERPATSPGDPGHITEAGFRQLGQIRELRRVINGSINAELSLAGLLLDWYGGLGHPEAQ